MIIKSTPGILTFLHNDGEDDAWLHAMGFGCRVAGFLDMGNIRVGVSRDFAFVLVQIKDLVKRLPLLLLREVGGWASVKGTERHRGWIAGSDY